MNTNKRSVHQAPAGTDLPKPPAKTPGAGPAAGGHRRRGPLLACVLVLASAAQTRADVIVSQPFNAGASGSFSNLGFIPSQQTADNFQLSAPTTLESFAWFGRYDGAVSLADPVAFSLRFFADVGGAPAAFPLAVFNVTVDALDTGLTFGGLPWFSYSTPFTLSLEPGSYWVSVLESDPRTATFAGSQWLWGQSNTAGPFAVRSAEFIVWAPLQGQDLAFTLTGTVIPEPSAFVLGGLGMLGLAGYRRLRTAGASKGIGSTVQASPIMT